MEGEKKFSIALLGWSGSNLWKNKMFSSISAPCDVCFSGIFTKVQSGESAAIMAPSVAKFT